MAETSIIETISAIGSIATPVIVLILTAVGWKLRQTYERRIQLEEKMRDARIEIYNKILEPFIILFTSEEAFKENKIFKNKEKDVVARSILYSIEYRTKSWELALIGTDGVVYAFNNLMQFVYNSNNNNGTTIDNLREMLTLFGLLLLEIRRSMGNEETHLNEWDMLEWIITDARTLKNSEIPKESTSHPTTPA